MDQYEQDRAVTICNREKLAGNVNLVYWYKKLYENEFRGIPSLADKSILEIGSGVSPLKGFHPSVKTSDVLDLDYLDYVFDCHEIDQVDDFPDSSLDIISLTNVLHHLKEPVTFLIKAAKKLKPGGKIIATEPYLSFVSSLIYKYIHPEPLALNIDQPVLDEISGPLSSANIALPYLIFVSNRGWDKPLQDIYTFSLKKDCYFTSLAYMVTGGISRRIPIPNLLYRLFFSLDLGASQFMPRMLASFFTITLTKRDSNANL